jgi:hypothetical protein
MMATGGSPDQGTDVRVAITDRVERRLAAIGVARG